ncbi:MAG: ParB/RepB/Spo0J family partition protein [Lachnospiraceae bacterium]|nr:ParB/RepB/Spo0J family partition protein [Lachnospiraceae bacterium]
MANKDKVINKEEPLETVKELKLSELVPFKNHPFKVRDDEDMEKTVESIEEFGVLNPVIVRPLESGGYEIVSGHRRCHAAELAGLKTVPAIVRELDDDAATILMVDSNLQRETILPSEKAWAMKMRYEAMKHQGERKDLTSSQIGTKFRTDSVLADLMGESRNQIQRYIALTNLIPELLEMVDNRQLAFNPAVELSYIPQYQQERFLEAMDYAQSTPSLSQAQRIKKLSQDGKCTLEAMCAVMDEEKKPEQDHITIKHDVLRKYFPKDYTPRQMEAQILKLLDQWQKKKELCR